ncbi:MAG: aldo/keto reductase [Bacteroidetes bacterium]|nr:aldo/keto reductase [Bacteroidota bacterium]
MEKRQLGKSDLFVAPFAFGGNVFGWTADEKTSFQLLDHFTAEGFNFIDTANIYSTWVPGHTGGESEQIIGNWLKKHGKRQQVVIATKVGGEMPPGKKGLSKKYIQRCVEDSLQRLRTDYIDLYQSHFDDPDTPQEETMEAYTELVRQGKVRHIGASNFSAARISSANGIAAQKVLHRYESIQPLYNLYDRQDFEKDLLPTVLKEQIGVIPYYSLASGFLTGKYRHEADTQQGARGARAKRYMNERGNRILAVLDQLSLELNSSPAKLSLAWLIAQPGITAAIASATSLAQLQELIAGIRLPLHEKAIRQLTAAGSYD